MKKIKTLNDIKIRHIDEIGRTISYKGHEVYLWKDNYNGSLNYMFLENREIKGTHYYKLRDLKNDIREVVNGTHPLHTI